MCAQAVCKLPYMQQEVPPVTVWLVLYGVFCFSCGMVAALGLRR